MSSDPICLKIHRIFKPTCDFKFEFPNSNLKLLLHKN